MRETTSMCKVCHQYFYYSRPHNYGRCREVCDLCRHKRTRSLTRARVAAYRARQRQAKKASQQTTAAKRPQPVIGSRPNRKQRGMFARDPEPERTRNRRKVGLP